MILQALVKHYEDLLEAGEISRPGWGIARVSFGLNLDREGNIIDLIPLKIQKEKGKKTIEEPQSMEVPVQEKRSGTKPQAYFLCDDAKFVFGIGEKKSRDELLQYFQRFSNLHQKLLQSVDCNAAKAILNFLQKWEPDRVIETYCVQKNLEELISGANILFYYEGQAVTKDTDIRQCWQRHYDSKSAEDGICMVTGQRTPIAILHPTIKGIYDAQAMGTSLVSFNAPAFCSYGKEQGENASVGEYAAFAYGTALNNLLSDREHTKAVGDTTIVCWVEGGGRVYQDVGIAAMFGSDEEGITDQDLSAIMEKVRKGLPLEVHGETLDAGKHFYILGLAPNAARLSVRFFWQDSFGNMLRHIGEHYMRLAIIKPAYDKYEDLPIWRLLQETVNKNAREKKPSSQMAADTFRAVLTGGRYPASLLNGVMIRIRAESEVTRGRAAIIKAYYLRNPNPNCPEEVLQMELNEESKNIPYKLGRLFALLEQIQQEANPGINSTIRDKYFNSAAASPAHIFPVLLNLSQKHLKKIKGDAEKGRYTNYYMERVEKIVEDMGETFPMRLTLPEQGSFYLGYYHQTQKRYQKKEEK